MNLNSKYLRWILLGVVAISFAINYASIFDAKIDQNGDNLCYFFLGKNLSEGNGYILGSDPQPTPHMHFPPGYPAFIAMVMKVFPDNTGAVKIINGLLYLLSICLLFRIIRKSVPKYGLVAAFLTAFLCTLHPVLLRWSTIMMSEMLYMAVSMGIIALSIDIDLKKLWNRDIKQILLLILLCALVFSTYFIRSIGISVIVAACVAFLIIAVKNFIADKEQRSSWLCPLAVVFLMLASFFAAKWSWDARNHKINPSFSGSYTANFMSKGGGNGKMEGFADWSERISTNLESFVTYYIPQSLFNPDEADNMHYSDIRHTAASYIFGILCVLLMVFGLIRLSSARWVILTYLILTFGVLLLYQEQFAGLRYMVPVIPLLVFAILAGFLAIADLIAVKLVKTDKTLYGILTVVVLSLILANTFIKGQKPYKQMATVKSEAMYPAESPYKQYIEASKFFTKAPEDYIVACRKPEVFYYFSKYHKCVRLPNSATPEAIIELLTKTKADAVILDCWFPQGYRVVLPAVQKYPQHFNVIGQFGKPQPSTFVLTFIP